MKVIEEYGDVLLMATVVLVAIILYWMKHGL